MFVVISSFEVQNGMESEVKQAFRNRPGFVDNDKGFIRLDVLSPAENPKGIWLLTYWKDEESFKDWHKNHLKDSHNGIPKGLKLVPHSFKLRFFEHITS
ncbi:MAG: antibiotic biosynthesis monooxygenase family protein [Ferruginibacter sp.]